MFGKVLSLFGYWTGSNMTSLDFVQSGSSANELLHRSFMRALQSSCRVENTLCVFEAVPNSIFGYPIGEVSQIRSLSPLPLTGLQ